MTVDRKIDRKQLGRVALSAAIRGEEGWQKPCVTLLYLMSKDYDAQGNSYSSIEAHFLRRLAAIIADTSDGILTPYFVGQPRVGRPKLDRVSQKRKFRLGFMVAMVMPKLKSRGCSIDTGYRVVARRLTTPSEKITWQEVRSAWINRNRFTAQQSFLIQQVIAVAESSPDPFGFYNTYATLIEMSEKSKTPLF